MFPPPPLFFDKIFGRGPFILYIGEISTVRTGKISVPPPVGELN